jgi:hypothetical protein
MPLIAVMQNAMSAHYHVCFTVPDLRAAMSDPPSAAAVTWRKPRDGRIGDWDFFRTPEGIVKCPVDDLVMAACIDLESREKDVRRHGK